MIKKGVIDGDTPEEKPASEKPAQTSDKEAHATKRLSEQAEKRLQNIEQTKEDFLRKFV